MLVIVYKNGSACTNGSNWKASTQFVDIPLRSSAETVAANYSSCSAEETAESTLQAAARSATRTRIFVAAMVESNFEFAEATATVESSCVIAAATVMAGRNCGTAEVTGTIEDNCATVEATAMVESSCWMVLAEGTTASSSVAFGASVSSANNWQVVEEKAGNT